MRSISTVRAKGKYFCVFDHKALSDNGLRRLAPPGMARLAGPEC